MKRMTENFLKKLKDVKLLAMDFDGVHTDGLVYMNEDGGEAVICSRVDGMGLELLRAHSDVKTCVISKEENLVVAARCRKLKIVCHQGIEGGEGKLETLKKIMSEDNLGNTEVIYIGDDVNDIPCLKEVIGVAVANARPEVKKITQYTTAAFGGGGAIREICDFILEAKGIKIAL